MLYQFIWQARDEAERLWLDEWRLDDLVTNRRMRQIVRICRAF
jgi:hypothetical protein